MIFIRQFFEIKASQPKPFGRIHSETYSDSWRVMPDAGIDQIPRNKPPRNLTIQFSAT
jgi:hypothetical protein